MCLHRHRPPRPHLITLGVEASVLRSGQGERVRVTAAEFVLVAVDDAGKPRKLPEEG